MKKFVPYLLLCVLVLLFIFVFVRRHAVEPVERAFLYFDTFVRISFYAPDEREADRMVPLLETELERIQERYGYDSTSLPTILANKRGVIAMTPEDIRLLERAKQLSALTDGAFDITIGMLQKVWGFKENNPHRPSDSEIDHALQYTGYEGIELLENSLTLKRDMIIDLGGISKGYAVDRAVELLAEEGIPAGLIDAGGDLRVFGTKPDGSRWIIGVRHPEERADVIGTFELEEGAVATSGTYERSFTENDTLYHHIIDPRTGYPPRECISVTVLAKDAVTADALATGIFVLGSERGMELAESLDGIEAIIIFREQGELRIKTSEGVELK